MPDFYDESSIRWRLEDGTLRLQRLRGAGESVLQPQLATDGGRALLSFLTEDRGGRP